MLSPVLEMDSRAVKVHVHENDGLLSEGSVSVTSKSSMLDTFKLNVSAVASSSDDTRLLLAESDAVISIVTATDTVSEVVGSIVVACMVGA